MRGDLHRAQVAIVRLARRENPCRRAVDRGCDPRARRRTSAKPTSSNAPRQRARSATVVFAASFHLSVRRLDDDDELVVARHRQMQALAGERLDPRGVAHTCLARSAAAPVGLQPIELAVQVLGLDEQLARTMLDVDDPDARRARRRRRAPGCDEPSDLLVSWLAHAACSSGVRSATRSRALRARGLRSSSAAPGRTSLPTSVRRGRACGGMFGQSGIRFVAARFARHEPLDDAVLERVEADDDEAAALAEQCHALRETALERAELVVERDANRLERSRRGMDAALRCLPGMCRDEARELAGSSSAARPSRARTIAAAICRARGSSP